MMNKMLTNKRPAPGSAATTPGGLTVLKKQPQNTLAATPAASQLSAFDLARIIDTIAEGIIITDCRGQFVYANFRAQSILGVPPCAVDGSWGFNITEHLFSLEGVPLSPESTAFAQVLHTLQTVFGMEYMAERLDGQRILISLSAAPLYDDAKNVIGVVASISDITARKKAEEDRRQLIGLLKLKRARLESLFRQILREQHRSDEMSKALIKHRDHLEELVAERTSELKTVNRKLRHEIIERNKAEKGLLERTTHLALITDNMLDMITQVDSSGIIQYISPSVTKILGYEYDQLIGMSILEIVHPDDLDRVVSVFMPFMAGTGPGKVEFRYKHKDGHYLWLESIGNLLFDEKHRITGAILSTRNITERKQLETEVARLERLNLVGEMAAGIGHEIRNPMTTARGFLQLLGDKKEFSQYGEYFGLIIDELDRANSIITEFLSMAKNKRIFPKLLSINSIVRALMPLIQADAIISDKMVISLLDDSIPDLMLDENEIRQLILNLARNGLEAMPPGRTLTLATYSEKGETVLSVHDEGPGINPDLLPKIGTPFFTTKETGTGLGLAICYSIAARHKASIKVQTDTQGTTFEVRFNP